MEQTLKGNAVERVWEISQDELSFEFMMNALRLVDGVPLNLFQQRTGLNIITLESAINKARSKGLLEVTNQHLRPTLLGQRFLNELLGLFLI